MPQIMSKQLGNYLATNLTIKGKGFSFPQFPVATMLMASFLEVTVEYLLVDN